jgi:hypothetical protein
MFDRSYLVQYITIIIRDFTEITKKKTRSSILTLPLQTSIIAVPHCLLGKIGSNITPLNDLSLYIKSKIIIKYEDGVKIT